MNPGGGPTPDKPDISVVNYEFDNTVSTFMNLRVADIQACYERWSSKGAEYATINTIFIWCFAALLPFCVVNEFDRLNVGVSGLLAGHMAWLAVPFSTLVSWMYVSLDQVGESTENPFEGAANDVPISHISRLVEIELGEILGETNLPPLLPVSNEIVL
jgi:predicted membrane chloride channel (bestrophin family)